jgi:hypothetical protein
MCVKEYYSHPESAICEIKRFCCLALLLYPMVMSIPRGFSGPSISGNPVEECLSERLTGKARPNFFYRKQEGSPAVLRFQLNRIKKLYMRPKE